MRKNRKGFTLIEIIVVIVILAVLMAVAVPSVLSYIHKADEAPALTECYAMVTAAQKKVVEKYAQSHDDNVSLNSQDIQWIEEFVDDVTGKIQGDITVKNKEVIRLLYKASNGLYVLYDKNKNPEYAIVSEDEINDIMNTQLNNMLQEYIDMTKELAKTSGNNLDRRVLIYQLAKDNKLIKVDDELKNAVQSKNDLYWKPYYIGDKDDPSMILFANSSTTDHGSWKSNLFYVNGNIYSCQQNQNIASFYTDYKTVDELEKYIKANPDDYEKIK